MHKTPARFPDCTGRSQGNCINFDPVEDHIKWCVLAEQRGSQCANPIQTSQASSTKRNMNCPQHRNKPDPSPKAADRDSGAGGSSGGSRSLVSGQGVKVEWLFDI
jgi:hypothetical protein